MKRLCFLLVLAACPVALLTTAPIERATAQKKKKNPDAPAATEQPNLKTVKPILAIDAPGHVDRVAAATFTADGRKLVTLGHDNTIQFWDATTRERLKTLRLPKGGKGSNHVQGASRLAVSPDGNLLALTLVTRVDKSVSKTSRCYDLFLVQVDTGRVMRLTNVWPFLRNFMSLTFSPDGAMLVVKSTHENDVHSRDLQFWRGLHDVTADSAVPKMWKEFKATHIEDVQFSPDGTKLVAAGSIHFFVPDPPKVKGKVSERGRNLHGHLVIWNLKQPKAEPRNIDLEPKASRVDSHITYVERLAWSPDGSRLAVVMTHRKTGYDPNHKVVKVVTLNGLVLRSGAYEQLQPAEPVFRGDNEVLLLGAAPADKKTPAILHLDLKQKSLSALRTFTPLPSSSNWKISPDGKRMVMIGGESHDEVALLDIAENAKIQTLFTIRETPSVAFSQTGSRFAWTGIDRTKLIAGVNLASAEQLADIKAGEFAAPADSVPKGPLTAVPSKARGGSVRIAKGKTNLLSFYAAGPEWVLWTSEGYYAASPGGEKLVGWHVNQGQGRLASFYPLQRFRKKFYRPDVIAELVDRGDLAEALKVANALRGKTETRDVQLDDLLPPRARLTVIDQSNLPTVKLKAEAVATAKDQPVTALRLLLDGRPVPGKQTVAEFPDGKEKVEVEWTFELPDGEHQLGVLARSHDVSGISPSLRLKHSDLKKRAVLHVLTVGINKYKDSALDLKFAAPDAEALSAAFAKHCKGEPFRDVVTRALTNEQATSAEIVAQLKEMRKQVQQQDLMIVFFACHGVKQKSKYYLLTHEANLNDLPGTALSGEKLKETLAECKCQTLLMLDACHAAGFGQGQKLAQMGLKPASDDVTRDLTEDESAVAVMCAAMSHEKAEGRDGHGLFTRGILDALEKKAGVPFNPFNQRIYVHHLHAYVFDHVSHQSEERQHPCLNMPWIVESFVIR